MDAFIKEFKQSLKNIDAYIHQDENYCLITCNDAVHREDVEELLDKLVKEYNNKYVPIEVLKQLVWERDIAVSQLSDLGYSLGEKIKYEKDEIETMEPDSLRKLLNMVPEDVKIEINSVFNENGECISVDISEFHYDKNKNKIYITPEIISLPELEDIEEDL